MAGRTIVACAVLLASCGGPPAPATPPTLSPDPHGESVERLLELTAVASIVEARAPDFTRRVAFMVGDPSDAELERLVPVVRSAFAPDRLRADIRASLLSEPEVALAEEVLTWLERGASADLRAASDRSTPSMSLQEFASSLTPDQVDPRLLDLVVRWAEVQQAGTFYVLLDQALEEAAYEVLGVLRPGGPGFEPLAGPDLTARLDASTQAAVVSFLHRYQTVPHELLERALQEYASESGRWFVEAYSVAVAEAMRSAGTRVVEALNDPGR